MIPNIFKRPGAARGRDAVNFDTENGTAINDASPPPYDVALAETAEKREKDMSFKEAREADKRLIWYSLGFSGTIIMEGYGLALITYLFSFAVFKAKYGVKVEGTDDFEVRRLNDSEHTSR